MQQTPLGKISEEDLCFSIDRKFESQQKHPKYSNDI